MTLGVVLAIGLVGGLALAWRRGDLPALDRVVLAVTPPALAVLVVESLPELVRVLEDDMCASRTVPALALARGVPIYAGPTGVPIIDFMYGPIAAVAFLPVALAGTPSGVLAIALATNALWFFTPMLLCLAAAGVPGRIVATTGVLFGFLVLWDPGLLFSALTIHADAPALGLSALACAPLVRRTTPPAAHALALSALCAALAVWAKQTSVPLVVAIPLWLWLVDGRRTAVAWVGWLAGIGVVLTAILLARFGIADLWFNMVTLPGRMPWYDEATQGKWPAAVRSFHLLVDQARWTLLLLAAIAGAGARDARWLETHRWALLVLVGLLGAPMAVLGGAKVGGYLNTHSVTNYFLAGAVVCGLARLAASASVVGRLLLLGLVVALPATWVANPLARAQVSPAVARLRAWSANPQEQAFAFARAHPGAVLLPWNPLASLLADGRVWNNEIGAWNRDLAGVPIGDAQWRGTLPPGARWLAHRPPRHAFTLLPPPNGRTPEYATPVQVPGLEGWTVLERAVP